MSNLCVYNAEKQSYQVRLTANGAWLSYSMAEAARTRYNASWEFDSLDQSYSVYFALQSDAEQFVLEWSVPANE